MIKDRKVDITDIIATTETKMKGIEEEGGDEEEAAIEVIIKVVKDKKIEIIDRTEEHRITSTKRETINNLLTKK